MKSTPIKPTGNVSNVFRSHLNVKNILRCVLDNLVSSVKDVMDSTKNKQEASATEQGQAERI